MSILLIKTLSLIINNHIIQQILPIIILINSLTIQQILPIIIEKARIGMN